MKLKCTAHGRRIIMLKGTGKWVHRTGDLSDCDSLNAKIGDEEIFRGTKYDQDAARRRVDPAQRLLYEIFAGGVKSTDA